MPKLQLIPSYRSIDESPVIDRESISEPERELNSFIESMMSLVGAGASGSLTELWLDELACMERVPGSENFNWRMVSASASVKLAGKVTGSQRSGSSF